MIDKAPTPISAAFFDLDNTLMKGASLFVLARHALRSGFYSRTSLMRDAFTQLSFRLGRGDDESSARVRERALASVAGKLQADMLAFADAIVEDIETRVFPGARERVAWHHEQGHRTYVVSASSSEVVGPVAARLGIDGAVATRPEVDAEGRYTGRILGPFVYGEGKAEAIRRIAAEEHIDLAESWAYSDSSSDLPMLELVGHPVVVNPDSTLAKAAAEHDWEVLRFERLGRRLAIGGGGTAALAAGGVGLLILLGLRRRERERASPPPLSPLWSRAGISRRLPRPPRIGRSTAGR
jgi:HAD superfamily hydrolase (TIGR01490 family)